MSVCTHRNALKELRIRLPPYFLAASDGYFHAFGVWGFSSSVSLVVLAPRIYQLRRALLLLPNSFFETAGASAHSTEGRFDVTTSRLVRSCACLSFFRFRLHHRCCHQGIPAAAAWPCCSMYVCSVVIVKFCRTDRFVHGSGEGKSATVSDGMSSMFISVLAPAAASLRQGDWHACANADG